MSEEYKKESLGKLCEVFKSMEKKEVVNTSIQQEQQQEMDVTLKQESNKVRENAIIVKRDLLSAFIPKREETVDDFLKFEKELDTSQQQSLTSNYSILTNETILNRLDGGKEERFNLMDALLEEPKKKKRKAKKKPSEYMSDILTWLQNNRIVLSYSYIIRWLNYFKDVHLSSNIEKSLNCVNTVLSRSNDSYPIIMDHFRNS